jgi:hypothetical protein
VLGSFLWDISCSAEKYKLLCGHFIVWFGNLNKKVAIFTKGPVTLQSCYLQILVLGIGIMIGITNLFCCLIESLKKTKQTTLAYDSNFAFHFHKIIFDLS